MMHFPSESVNARESRCSVPVLSPDMTNHLSRATVLVSKRATSNI